MAISWVITKNTATGIARYEVTGVVPVDLNNVLIGDYVNITGTGFSSSNRGSFEIKNVEVFYVGITLHQAFEVLNLDCAVEVAIQSLNTDLTFFRPTRNTILTTNNRTVSVSSTENGKLNVIIPATTEIVNRTIKTGSYLHKNDSQAFTRVSRNKDGQVTAYYTGTYSPALSVGDFIYVDNFIPAPFEAFKSLGVAGVYPATGTSDASNVTNITAVQVVGADTGRKNFALLRAANGDGLIIGGHSLLASVPQPDNAISRFRPVSSATVSDATLADGSTRYTYQWMAPGTDGLSTEWLSASNVTSGTKIGKVLITGGLNVTDGNYNASAAPVTTSFLYDPVANTTAATSAFPDGIYGQSQLTLTNGKIISIGGGETVTGVVSNRASLLGYVWDFATELWPFTYSLTLFEPRAVPRIVQLNNGNVLISGGFGLASEMPTDASTLAQWKMNETGGATLNDATTVYNLTTTGTTAAVGGTKIGYGREFTQAGAFASGAGDGNAVTALLGEWTVEWWSCGATGTYPGSMVLSGLGSGTIVEYGAASETEANNTLMNVKISGGNIVWRWEHGAGLEVTGSAAVSGHLVDHYNHFAVRKKYNGATYDVAIYCNGKKLATQINNVNATGGSTSAWSVARETDTATLAFTGVIDDLRVSKVARSDAEILLDFFNGSGSLSRAFKLHRVGKLVETCEIWDGTSPTTTHTGQMMLARALHTIDLLADGRVLVTGGLAHDPSSFLGDLALSTGNSLNGPSASTNQCEIYDHNTRRWERIQPAGIRRHGHSTVYVPEKNSILLVGGESTQGDDTTITECLDLTTMKWSQFPEKTSVKSAGTIRLSNGTILSVTSQLDGVVYSQANSLINPLESSVSSNGGLNNYFKITELGSGYLKFNTPENKGYTASFGKVDKTSKYIVTTAIRTSNVTTLTFASSGHAFIVGQPVYVNLNNTGSFSSGPKTVTVVTANTISYAEIAGNVGATSVTGEVFMNYAPDSEFFAWGAVTDTIPGPYLIDPIEGLAITETDSTIGGALYTGIYKNQKYSVLPLVDATVFPDEEGFVLIGFGRNIQTKPIKYFGRYSSVGLLLDYNYTFVNDIPTGTDVTLLNQRVPFAPGVNFGGLYLTDSISGRVAAEETTKAIVAAGVDLNVEISYPGDRGLGAEGYPAKNSSKLSDKTVVWGSGTDLDDELKGLKD